MQNRSTPRPRAAYWWCQVAGWGAFFLVNVFTSEGFVSPSWRLTSGYFFLSLAGIFLTHFYRGVILRGGWIRLPVRKLIPRALAANLLLALILVVAVTIYFSLLPPPGIWFGSRGRIALFATWGVFTFNDFIIFTLWSGIYFGVAYFEQQRRAEIAHYQAQTALAQAELRGLRSQLNPHFLFNSLNSLRALVLEDAARAQEAITQMAAILRYHLQSEDRALVPLADELRVVEQYLALELIRFEDRLTIEQTIDPAARTWLVPPLALQTLVENAVKYGVSRELGRSTIQLSARIENESLVISVRNNGRLLSTTESESTGLGLTNLKTRLRLLFADRASLDLCEPEPGCVEARLILPGTSQSELSHT